MTAITNSIATKQATIPQNLSLQTGFVGIWDSINTIMKGLVCTAPLLVTSASAYLGLALSTTATYTMGALACTGLATVGSLHCNGNATTTGNLTVGGVLNSDALVWASGKISSTGAILTAQGGSTFTCARSTGFATGVFHITFSAAHPSGGGNYTIHLTSQYPAVSVMVRSSTVVQASTGFDVILQNSTWACVDAVFYFMVMNW